jgi:hypothetical protein
MLRNIVAWLRQHTYRTATSARHLAILNACMEQSAYEMSQRALHDAEEARHHG